MALLNKATVARLIRSNALRKGLLGGSPFWRAVWVASFLRRRWAKVSKGGEAPIAFAEPLKEGEAWTLVHVPEDSARGRGEGRKLVLGPRRARPRATALAGPALSAIGAKILEAPSAERINQILGETVVEDPAPSRAQIRATKKAQKVQAKADAAAAKADAKNAAARERNRARVEADANKAASKAAKAQAKTDAKAASVAAKTAKAERRAAERAARSRKAKKAAKAEARASKHAVASEDGS